MFQLNRFLTFQCNGYRDTSTDILAKSKGSNENTSAKLAKATENKKQPLAT